MEIRSTAQAITIPGCRHTLTISFPPFTPAIPFTGSSLFDPAGFISPFEQFEKIYLQLDKRDCIQFDFYSCWHYPGIHKKYGQPY